MLETKMATNDKLLRKKKKKSCSPEELATFTREELVTRIQELESQTFQLRNIIQKQTLVPGSSNCSPRPGKKASRPFDFSRHHKRHVLLRFLYLGWDYKGYAVQEDTPHTIEHHLFEALQRSCLIADRQSSNYHRCGRTDKGVSAFSQVISLDIRSCLTPETENNVSKELPYCKLMNRILPEDIRMIAWCPAPKPDTSARFDCTRRTYRYFFPRANMDISAMQQAASFLVGVHDFRNLCKMDVGNGVVDFTRSIFKAQVQVLNNENRKSEKEDTESMMECCDVKLEVTHPYDMCEFVFSGRAFLWHQVRCIVAILILVGSGKEAPEVVRSLLDKEKCARKPQYSLASELPLCLFECEYEVGADSWVHDQEELARLVGDLQAAWASNAIKSEMIRQMLVDLEPRLTSPVHMHSSSLIQGVQSKVYQPLLTRDTCASLENRIEHFVRKRRLEVVDEVSSSTSASKQVDLDLATS